MRKRYEVENWLRRSVLVLGLCVVAIVIGTPQVAAQAIGGPAIDSPFASDTLVQSRAAQLEALRVSKRDDLEPPEKSFFQRLGQRIDVSGVLDRIPGLNVAGFSIQGGGIQSGAGTTLGLRYEPTQSFLRVDDLLLRFEVQGSERGYAAAKALAGYDNGHWLGYGFARYRHLPQDDLYGIGPDVPKSARADFRRDEGLFGVLLGVSPYWRTQVGVHGSYMTNRIGPGTDRRYPDAHCVFTSTEVPALDRGIDYFILGGFFEFDGRNTRYSRSFGRRFAPTEDRLRGLSLTAERGLYLAAEATHYFDQTDGAFDFTRIQVETHQYIPIRRGYEVFAFRQLVSFSQAGSVNEVPFYLMETLGGNRTIRGYDTFRFRDRHAVILNAEFRWQIWLRAQMALFADAGQVFHESDELNPGDFRTGYGVGLRVRSRNHIYGRIEVARSVEGVQLYTKFGSFL